MADQSSNHTPPGPFAAFWAAFSENRGALMGLYLVGAIIAMAILAGLLAPHSPYEQFRDAVLAPPVWAEGGSSRFLLGTDDLGRDMLSRLLYGARVSLFIGVAVMSVSLAIGIILGLVCAIVGGLVDVIITRIMDLIMAVPSLVMAKPDQHNCCRNNRLFAALCAAGAGICIGGIAKGLCDGRPRYWRAAAAADVCDHSAQLPSAAHGAGSLGNFGRDSRSRCAWISGPGCTAANAGMGLYAGRCPQSHPLEPRHCHDARPVHPRNRHCHKSHRRWIARRA